ncbi:Histone H2AX [Hibiscus syriacus]|uniref:Histone H2AX n=1 Tax=Hibiscus syriacus TaxID=106335 RepID=A0A6A2XVG6_HIBSY|nr:histone H2AX-like [Hibiscus syriacus]KAE8662399.1 Histone H2AX [Hibiscus syriacus]
MSSAAETIKGGRGKPKSKVVSWSSKAGLQFPVGRVARFLKKGRYAQCVGSGFSSLSLCRTQISRRRGSGIGWKRGKGQQEEQNNSEAYSVGGEER